MSRPVDVKARPDGLPASIRHYIGGAWVDSADGAMFPLADPVSNEPYATVAAGGATGMDAAVGAANELFDAKTWSDARARSRARVRPLTEIGQVAEVTVGAEGFTSLS